MKIIFFGTPSPVIPILDVLLKNFEVLGIVTAPDHWVIRKKQHVPSPIKAYYQKYLDEASRNKPHPPLIFTPENFSSLISHFSSLKPDLFVVAAYGKILPQKILNIPTFGTICIHPSLLPKYRGASPIPQTLLDGEKVTGTTIIKMDEKMDHGPILSISPFTIHETDTYQTLMNHLFQLGATALPDVIKNYTEGKITPESQDDSQATFTKLIKKSDGLIDLENPPDKTKLNRMIRAYYPWPTVWSRTQLNGQEKIIKFLPDQMIQMEGKKPQNLKDFLNGYPELKGKIEKLY